METHIPLCTKLAKFRVTTIHFLLKSDIKATKIKFFHISYLTTYASHKLYQKILKKNPETGPKLIPLNKKHVRILVNNLWATSLQVPERSINSSSRRSNYLLHVFTLTLSNAQVPVQQD